ncbi:MAG TPA: ATP-binding cassette domain-containing protein [Thermoanaerobaculia bacterium]|nr:ATP-binding cassette domain-containing protein [Thermoanaerobaculia bacterium]HUM30558.1 ATP-binding cassette domain-containing protein [Thermoanaerobaculia bacterium]HXK68750.1 ATP-binding cassette domain-containing protein [Thermoanaerobaculia bacterium]
MNRAFFELRQVSKSFGPVQVLQKADIEVRKGETLVILGPSGSGKSVSLRLLVGLDRCDEGEILVDGTTITNLGESELWEFRKRIGFLFQGGALFDSLTVFENIAFPLREHRDLTEEEIARIVEEKLDMVELEGTGHLHPSSLSGGMQKRAALARALALDPEAILYDEPTTGLDPPTADTINDLIVHLNERLKVTSIVVTHDIHCALKVAHRIAILNNKKFPEVLNREDMKTTTHETFREFLHASEVHLE